MTSPMPPERMISTIRIWSCENRSTWPGKTKPAELRSAARSGTAALAEGAAGFSSNTAEISAERARANLDMGVGRRGDDDGVSLDACQSIVGDR